MQLEGRRRSTVIEIQFESQKIRNSFMENDSRPDTKCDSNAGIGVLLCKITISMEMMLKLRLISFDFVFMKHKKSGELLIPSCTIDTNLSEISFLNVTVILIALSIL